MAHSLVLTEMINSQMYSFNSTAGISSTFLSSFQVLKRVCKSFTSSCVFCNVALTFVFLLCNKIVN